MRQDFYIQVRIRQVELINLNQYQVAGYIIQQLRDAGVPIEAEEVVTGVLQQSKDYETGDYVYVWQE